MGEYLPWSPKREHSCNTSSVRFRLTSLAQVCKGTLVGDDREIDAVSIDSRDLPTGALFIPLVAERDGHGFIDDAIANGAVAHLTSDGVRRDQPHIAVTDTARALTHIGTYARSLLSTPVVGVTGSVGKTSAKDLIEAAVRPQRRVHASYKSFNNELGVPLTLANAPDDTQIVVVEMGARGAGHIAHLCDIASPTIGLVTRVGAAHTELFGSVADVATAKGELIEALPRSGTAVLNADDDLVLAMASRSSADVLTFGLSVGDVRAENISMDAQLRPAFVARTPWGDADVGLGVSGMHNVAMALGALAVAGVCGVAIEEAAFGLGEAVLSPWRMEVKQSPSGATVINDAYNANPLSTESALRSLAALPGRRVAVLGTMAELGSEHDASHLAMAEVGASLDIEVISFQEPAYRCPTVQTHDEALAAIGLLDARVAVLVKGSRVAGLEDLAERLLSEPTTS
jgi:UDP-N-acetylmuramoyl-tripeptide--D-alanyl-D-alanine ligase